VYPFGYDILYITVKHIKRELFIRSKIRHVESFSSERAFKRGDVLLIDVQPK